MPNKLPRALTSFYVTSIRDSEILPKLRGGHRQVIRIKVLVASVVDSTLSQVDLLASRPPQSIGISEAAGKYSNTVISYTACT